jgi:enterochelin esterase-like enzyme
MKRRALFFLIAINVFTCTKTEKPNVDYEKPLYHVFDSFNDFKSTLTGILKNSDAAERDKSLLSFWDSLKANHQIPFVFEDSVAFLYKGSETAVSWAGDFSGWSPTEGVRLEDGDVWMLERVFPTDARLDYKIVVGGNWILDPANDFIQYSGFGPNSELRMPEWVYPVETVLSEDIPRGDLSDNIIISSSTTTLNYKIQYRIYTPFGYHQLDNLPVIYVTDGHEYLDDKLGSMIIILDNLIDEKLIPPIIAVFIDPRDPDSGKNKRQTQYTGNLKFVDFVADELVSEIDINYKTNNSADARAIFGTSLGGWNSAYFGVNRSDIFQLICIHSPAFDSNVIEAYEDVGLLPLKIFMSTGVIHDTQDKARALKEVLDLKHYPLKYVEVNEGHSWGNWRAQIKGPLVYFFSN